MVISLNVCSTLVGRSWRRFGELTAAARLALSLCDPCHWGAILAQSNADSWVPGLMGRAGHPSDWVLTLEDRKGQM